MFLEVLGFDVITIVTSKIMIFRYVNSHCQHHFWGVRWLHHQGGSSSF